MNKEIIILLVVILLVIIFIVIWNLSNSRPRHTQEIIAGNSIDSTALGYPYNQLVYPYHGSLLIDCIYDPESLVMTVSQFPEQNGTVIVKPPFYLYKDEITKTQNEGAVYFSCYLIQRQNWFIYDVKVNVNLKYKKTGEEVNITITKYYYNPIPELKLDKPFDRYKIVPQNTEFKQLPLVWFW